MCFRCLQNGVFSATILPQNLFFEEHTTMAMIKTSNPLKSLPLAKAHGDETQSEHRKTSLQWVSTEGSDFIFKKINKSHLIILFIY